MLSNNTGKRLYKYVSDYVVFDNKLIFAKDILINKLTDYFTDEAKTEVYDKFAKSLKKGGILFIGSTEQVIEYKELGYSRRYSFYYEKA